MNELAERAYILASILEHAELSKDTEDRVWAWLDGLWGKFLSDWRDGNMSISDLEKWSPEAIENKIRVDIVLFKINLIIAREAQNGG